MMNTARAIATEFGPVVAGKEESVCELVNRNRFGTSWECIAKNFPLRVERPIAILALPGVP
jgi:hypothetical protein